jgi:hypothetical protein
VSEGREVDISQRYPRFVNALTLLEYQQDHATWSFSDNRKGQIPLADTEHGNEETTKREKFVRSQPITNSPSSTQSGLHVLQDMINSFDVDQALKVIDQAIRDANVTVYDIANIIPGGDSSRIPNLRSLIKKRFSSTTLIHEELDPRLLTTYGAAIQGFVLSSSAYTACYPVDVTPWSLGKLRLSRTLLYFD